MMIVDRRPSRTLVTRGFIGALTAAALLPWHVIGAQGRVPSPPFVAFAFQAGATAVDADSATLEVPLHHGAREARRGAAASTRSVVQLPLVRFRATDRAASAAPPIIYISGGSGSGIAAARGPRLPMFQRLRDHGDVIAFDIRGAGRSTPTIACPRPEPLPLAAAEYGEMVRVLRANAAACASLLRSRGVDITAFNLRETVEDIESIRRALGAERVVLVGISTGSQIGLEYVRRHGDRVAHAVLAGVQAPDQTVDLPSEQEAVLAELSRTLASESSPSAPSLIDVIRSVVTTLGERPALVRVPRGAGDTVSVGLGPLDVQLLTAAMLGDRQQMAALPALAGPAARGDYRYFAAAKLQASAQGINSAFEDLQDCQSGVAASRLEARRIDARTALLGMGTLDFPEHCAGWGVPALDASWRTPVRSGASVLLISGTLDGRTSVANARAALRHLPNGVHLVVQGSAHGDDLFLSSAEIVPAIEAFLRGEAPRELRVSAPARAQAK